MGTAPIDWSTVDAADWYQPLKLYYKEIWDSGKVDLLVTRFGSMEDYFRQHNIRTGSFSPLPVPMLETFRGLVMQLRTQSMHDSAACLGLIRSIMPLSKEQWAALGTVFRPAINNSAPPSSSMSTGSTMRSPPIFQS